MSFPVASSIVAPVHLALSLNGAARSIEVEPRAVLLDVLREQLGLTGAKKGCDHGQCGACTVMINGRRVLSCLSLAAMHDGDEITTIEGLAQHDELHPMQAAFLDHDAYQCGYCTSGQIMSAVALTREPVGDDDAAVREAMSGNLCRCGAYKNICAAIQATRKRD
jgi:xanthine dehydrogenase YagT iron-sulfur-binding subunit